MKISDDRTLQELQSDFSADFPFLSIEFAAPDGGRLPASRMVGEVRKVRNSGWLNLDGNLSASALEQTFQNIFDLRAQVCRKLGGKRPQSPASASRTLREDNLRAMVAAEQVVFV